MLKIVNKNIFIIEKSFFIFLNKYICRLLLSCKKWKFFLDRLKIISFYKNMHRNPLILFRDVCFFTTRARGNYSFFKLSRFRVKQLAWGGLLVGIRRLSW